jgi:hypothetical protein
MAWRALRCTRGVALTQLCTAAAAGLAEGAQSRATGKNAKGRLVAFFTLAASALVLIGGVGISDQSAAQDNPGTQEKPEEPKTKEQPKKGTPKTTENPMIRRVFKVKHVIYGRIYVEASRSDITNANVTCKANAHVIDEGGIGDINISGVFTSFKMSSEQHAGEHGSYGDSSFPDPKDSKDSEKKPEFPARLESVRTL